MKILFYLSRYPGYGGIEKVTTILANYFVENLNFSVSILTVSQEDETKLLQQLSPKIDFLKTPFKNITDKHNVEFINSIIREKGIEILIYQDSYAPTEHLLYKIQNDIKPKIITVEHNSPDNFKFHHYNFLYSPCKNITDIVIKFLYPYFICKVYVKSRNRHKKLIDFSDKYIVLSEKFVDIIKTVLKINNLEKIYCIGNPLTIEPSTIIEKEKLCIFVGRLTYQKGIDKLLKIWNSLEDKHPLWKLQIIGDGELRPYIENYIQNKKLKNISLIGFCSNMHTYYQKASILLMTSIFEGWGLVLTEGMSYGVVPIAFDSYASVSEIINNNVDGYLIKPFNSKEYVCKINNLLLDEFLLKRMSQAAIKKSEIFNIESTAQNWLKCFESLKS